MPYYIEGEVEGDFLKITKPEEIRLLDPAVGSGHMLTYAFDLLYLIYEEQGYLPTEIPGLILRHNLHGLEICPRAAQLAELALVFKAREKSRRFFQAERLVRPCILALRDVRFAEDELRDYIAALTLGDLFNQPMLRLLHQFEEAITFGSLIQPCLDERQIAFARRAIEAKDTGEQLFLRETHAKVLRALTEAEALARGYHVVVTNPPYMGGKQMNPSVKRFANEQFADAKADVYGCFIARSLRFTIPKGMVAVITPPNWLFLSSFEKLRRNLLGSVSLLSLVHIGRGVWGSDFGSAAFVFSDLPSPFHRGTFLRLFSRPGEVLSNEELDQNFHNTSDFPRYRAAAEDFRKIPGSPIAYWLSKAALRAFAEFQRIGAIAKPRQGMSTNDNTRFLRKWHEVAFDRAGFGCSSLAETVFSGRKWFPYNKGGEFRKWFGNRELLVNWKNDGEEIKAWLLNNPNDPETTHWSRRIINTEFYCRAGITWTFVSSSSFGVRFTDGGFLFDVGGSSLFPGKLTKEVLALLASRVAWMFLQALNPTLNFQAGNIADIPWRNDLEESKISKIRFLADECIAIARADWDNFETSWDFREHPLLRSGVKTATLEASWQNWEAQSTAAIRRMQELETENNRLFIAAYGLAGELQPEVPENQITLARADVHRDMAAFLSYAVGCMMGRYSFDMPGLILANASETLREFLQKVGKPLDALTYTPVEDGIVPMLDGDWFEDDIVGRAREFLRVTFGKQTLEQNLVFLEDALGKDLRKYFITDFYKDHLQTYKKRPIYWLFQSPQKHFSALVYLHRYTRDTVNTLLNGYLREFSHKLAARIRDLQHTLESESVTPRDKTRAQKEIDKAQKARADVELYEREILLPLAQKRLEIDLDDGVKANYPKFGLALAPIAGMTDEEDINP